MENCFKLVQSLTRKAEILGELAKVANPTKAAQLERKRNEILNSAMFYMDLLNSSKLTASSSK